jgi:hypothetical protein
LKSVEKTVEWIKICIQHYDSMTISYASHHACSPPVLLRDDYEAHRSPWIWVDDQRHRDGPRNEVTHLSNLWHHSREISQAIYE